MIDECEAEDIRRDVLSVLRPLGGEPMELEECCCGQWLLHKGDRIACTILNPEGRIALAPDAEDECDDETLARRRRAVERWNERERQ